jgi:UDP-3-O-[3-hydroxymyristoyl] glucosamine N-acyltransferase
MDNKVEMTIHDIIDALKPFDSIIVTQYVITNALPIDAKSFDMKSIGWCADKNAALLDSIETGTVIISKSLNTKLVESKQEFQFNRIVVDNPRLAFAEVLRRFFVKNSVYGVVHERALIHSSVEINRATCNIGANVVIEENVQIGNHVTIGANTVIKSETVINDHVIIGSNCTIGGIGFGYEMNENGQYEQVPHIGNVEIGEKVEIGNNVCIDRAVMGSTTLDRSVKVDNLVHIAHGVHIQENSLIIAHAMIAGSVVVGKNTWIAPSASLKQKIKIGDNAVIGIGSVVLKDVEEGETVAGVPAKKIIEKE